MKENFEINNKEIDIIIIATPNFMIREIALYALNNQKHVLSEKPLGKNSIESKELSFKYSNNSLCVIVWS